MPNKPVPAAAEGLATNLQNILLEAVDQLGHTKGAIDLVDYALDGMSGQEISAIQYGLWQIRKEVLDVLETVEAARRIAH
ncbi:hypothetical protein G6L91_11535 [Agrobacterium rhizogenes]|uniref:hypothetical protein n=1 Tax=Rhizobium rhizogenes TaxID=359 RepID=UPI001572E3C2|nr:hypothetical protein [Rhizobium rhizogenes]NTF62099.1 hypothetical protein [Rhizobium rhizogenes]